MGNKNKKSAKGGSKKQKVVHRKPERSRFGSLGVIMVVLLAIGAGVGGMLLFTQSGEVKPHPEALKIAKEAKIAKGTPLAASSFSGNAAAAYQIASEIPGILDRMKCYCGCDADPVAGHKTLLSCFIDNHGANCNICIDEALLAQDLYNRGIEVKEIRAEIDRRYKKS